MKVCIFDIKRFALHDGPGIRTTVFLKGCPLNCQWCHNPEGIGKDVERFTEERKLDGVRFLKDMELGRWIGLEDLMEELLLDRIFMEESGGGISFSGGEPLQQADALFRLLELCGEQKLHTIVDTSGYAPKEIILKLSEECDLILYDLKTMNDELHREYTGVSNEKILENLKTLAAGKAELIVRIPFISGFNDSDEEIDSMLVFLADLNGLKEVDLLPFHRFGTHKYLRFNKKFSQNGFSTPPAERIMEVAQRFKNAGFLVKTGG